MRPRGLIGLTTPKARLVVLPAGLGVLAALGPERLSRMPTLCLVRRVFGTCPACGVSRSMAALLRGDLRPRRRRGLGALVLATLGAVVLSDVWRLAQRRPPTGRGVRVSTVIDAPPDEVWANVRDIASHVDWMQDAEAIRFTSAQRAGVATSFECDTRVGPFRLRDPMEVTEWEEGRAMTIRHGGVVTGEGRFSLEPAPGGRTRFIWDEELAFPWWMGGAIGSQAAQQVLRLVWARNLANLKRRLESRPPDAISGT